jgi:hypothetical protein
VQAVAEGALRWMMSYSCRVQESSRVENLFNDDIVFSSFLRALNIVPIKAFPHSEFDP